MKVGVILPSRGLVFSKTMESVIANLKGYDFTLYMAHNLPIPDCFNEPITRALKDKVAVLWFVEEDMTFPMGTFKKMLDIFTGNDKVAVTGVYADRRTGKNLICSNEKGTVIYTGMGCLLVSADIVAKLDKPYVQRACFEKIKTKNGFDYKLVDGVKNEWYGTQDVYFSYSLRKLGLRILTVEAKIGHLQLIKRGVDEKNTGTHEIEEVFITSEEKTPPFEFIGGPKLGGTRQVIPKISGVCSGYNFSAGVKTLLPSEIIHAVGQENFTFL